MGRVTRLIALVVMALGLTGCVERRFLVVSNPPGATVLVNGENVGVTPASVPFTYYGKYDITLIRDGYQTRTYEKPIRRPWFEYFPLDFFAENVYPGHIQDNRVLTFEMEPLIQPRTEDVLNQARTLRERGTVLPSPLDPIEN